MQKIISIIIALMAATVMVAQNSTTEYQGGQSVIVGGKFGPYEHSNSKCTITHNENGTISLTISKYELSATVIGDLYVSDMTIQNIPFDEATGAYAKDYTSDNISVHIKAASGDKVTMDNVYAITKLGNVSVTISNENTVNIVNNFQPGNMPFPIAATFSGQATTTGINPSVIVNDKHQSRAFTISGMHANSATRGIIIRNGKKYIAK